MGKQKSSATSATRKKHARKAATHDEDDSGAAQSHNKPNVKGGGNAKGAKGKGKKKEPRVKMYIPPVKPTALLRDPVDELGLAAVLDPEMLVLFRRLAKRDAVTKRRALEDLCVTLANLGSSTDEQGIASWASVLPVWVSDCN
jgi:E3 ubiquitin-protein ligase listerin